MNESRCFGIVVCVMFVFFLMDLLSMFAADQRRLLLLQSRFEDEDVSFIDVRVGEALLQWASKR